MPFFPLGFQVPKHTRLPNPAAQAGCLPTGDCQGVPSGVIKHGWLENPRAECRFLARKIIDLYGPFSSTLCLMTLEGKDLKKESPNLKESGSVHACHG